MNRFRVSEQKSRTGRTNKLTHKITHMTRFISCICSAISDWAPTQTHCLIKMCADRAGSDCGKPIFQWCPMAILTLAFPKLSLSVTWTICIEIMLLYAPPNAMAIGNLAVRHRWPRSQRMITQLNELWIIILYLSNTPCYYLFYCESVLDGEAWNTTWFAWRWAYTWVWNWYDN